jgi:hypothetical protein
LACELPVYDRYGAALLIPGLDEVLWLIDNDDFHDALRQKPFERAGVFGGTSISADRMVDASPQR